MLWIDLNNDERLATLAATEEATRINSNALEKDWWVSFILKTLFQTSCKDELVFKGGTSLSKGWKLIERFSEDIDLAINRTFFGFPEEISRTQVSRLRKTSLEYIETKLIPELDELLKSQGLHSYKLALDPPKGTDDDPVVIFVPYESVLDFHTYVSPQVKIEIGCRSLREPFEPIKMRSLLAEHFPDAEFAEDYFIVNTVTPARTFLEKCFLLHELFVKENGNADRRSRHLYDIFRMMDKGFAKNAIRDKELYVTIVKHREHFTRISGVNYKTHHPSTIDFVPPISVTDAWKRDYDSMVESFIYGDAPGFDIIIAKLRELRDVFRSVELKDDFFIK